MQFRWINLLIVTCFLLSGVLTAGTTVQDDTVMVIETKTVPVIDGIADDACWSQAGWQPIAQVWMEYAQPLDSTDFSARYKAVWSSPTNLIYFLVETVDDVIVDGYVYNSDQSIGDRSYDFDILEVFIDADKSGGLHVFDGTGGVGRQWGTNAENAFSYHIAVNFPGEGKTTSERIVGDITGQDWSNCYIQNYAQHFDDFILRTIDGKYVWEFSLKVFGDSYNPSDPQASRQTLKAGDIMGISLAYCDNDDPDEHPKKRDHFIGSVWVRPEANNDHWMNADEFGTMILKAEPDSGI